MKYFDYLYFRTYRKYMKWNEPDPKIYSIILVALMQFLNLLLAHQFLIIFIDFSINLKPILIGIILVLIAMNYHRYNKVIPYASLEKKWKDEVGDLERRRGRFLVLYVVLSVLIPVIYGILKNNIIDGASFI